MPYCQICKTTVAEPIEVHYDTVHGDLDGGVGAEGDR